MGKRAHSISVYVDSWPEFKVVMVSGPAALSGVSIF